MMPAPEEVALRPEPTPEDRRRLGRTAQRGRGSVQQVAQLWASGRLRGWMQLISPWKA